MYYDNRKSIKRNILSSIIDGDVCYDLDLLQFILGYTETETTVKEIMVAVKELVNESVLMQVDDYSTKYRLKGWLRFGNNHLADNARDYLAPYLDGNDESNSPFFTQRTERIIRGFWREVTNDAPLWVLRAYHNRLSNALMEDEGVWEDYATVACCVLWGAASELGGEFPDVDPVKLIENVVKNDGFYK